MDISMQIVWAEKKKIQRKYKNGNRQTWKKVKKLKNIRDREKNNDLHLDRNKERY